MRSDEESTAQLRTESWGFTEEGGCPTLPRGESCRQCDSPTLSEFSLCQECFGRLPEDLCTAHVLDALGP